MPQTKTHCRNWRECQLTNSCLLLEHLTKRQTSINAYISVTLRILKLLSLNTVATPWFFPDSRLFTFFFVFFNLNDELLIDSTERFVVLLSRWQITHGELTFWHVNKNPSTIRKSFLCVIHVPGISFSSYVEYGRKFKFFLRRNENSLTIRTKTLLD